MTTALHLLLLLLATASPARATCDLPRLVRSITPDGHSYLSTPGYLPGPGESSVSTVLLGSFWIIGAGDPAPGTGVDNGSFRAVAGDGSGGYYDGWVALGQGFGAVISTTWAASEDIDGCVDEVPGQRCMAVLLSDRDAEGNGYFAFLSDSDDPNRNFDFVQSNNGTISLAPVPPPQINGVTRTGPLTVQADVDPPSPPAEAFHGDPSCPEAAPAGYRLRSLVLPRGTASPTDPDVTLWEDLHPGGLVDLGQPSTVELACQGTSDIYLATSLVFEGGFELHYVSARSVAIACGDCSGTDADGDGYCAEPEPDLAVDCDDSNPAIFPFAPQICDGANNDCLHPGWPATGGTTEVDDDGDGASECAGDCDDLNPDVLPGATQICDGLNNNCADPNWPALPAYELDSDEDGFTECSGDCDDVRPDTYPGAPEECDGIANDCLAPAWPDPPPDESDEDGDGVFVCSGDCDDTQAQVFPGAPQICDGLNNDCDAPDWPQNPDDDNDSDGDGFAPCAGDCDDGAVEVNPNAEEVCNGIDDDCDGATDGELGGAGPDTDGDTIGDLCDNCVDVYNPTQTDTDEDGIGSSCDNCTYHPNPGQRDFDLDNVGDACDNCRVDFNVFQGDVDFDRVGDACDNCFFTYNPSQSNIDPDADGDHCDFDDGLILIEFFDPGFVDWQGEEQGFGAWNWYRGDLDELKLTGDYTQLPGSNPVAAQACQLVDPFVADPELPEPGHVTYFLVAGIDGNGEHGIGTDSSGAERLNDNPCP